MFINGENKNYTNYNNYINREIDLYCKLEGISLSEIKREINLKKNKKMNFFKKAHNLIKNIFI